MSRGTARNKKHGYDVDNDRCRCGGQIVYFEDIPRPTYGCEVGGPQYTRSGRAVDKNLRDPDRRLTPVPPTVTADEEGRGGFIIDTPEGIKFYQLCVHISRLKIETELGLRSRRNTLQSAVRLYSQYLPERKRWTRATMLKALLDLQERCMAREVVL